MNFKKIQFHYWGLATLILSGCLAFLASGGLAVGSSLNFQKGDRIVFIGNTFAERLGRFGHFETLLSIYLPEQELTFRNLGWSADTLNLQPRPLNFGDLFTHLEEQNPDVLFACFGMNESFAGPEGLQEFEQNWRHFLDRVSETSFNGTSPPRVVMVSPIFHEDLGRPLPDPSAHNANLELYTEKMRSIATDYGLVFIDLFSATRDLAGSESASPLTFNGIHLTRYGDWVVSQLMVRELGLRPSVSEEAVDAASTGQPLKLEVPIPLAISPPVAEVHSEIWKQQPVIRVTNLDQGEYLLKKGDSLVARGDSGEWAQGIRIRWEPDGGPAEKVRRTIVEKNQQFFYRWRAVNGEYIYGRRKEPFGVVNFPAEMEQLERIVIGLDKTIWEMSRDLRQQSLRLVPASGPEGEATGAAR